MASLRKRHRELTDELPPELQPPSPVEGAAAVSHILARDETQSPKPSSPAADAAPAVDQYEDKVAMRKRRQEMEAAQQRVSQLETQIAQQAQIQHQLQQAPQQQQPSVETIIANAPLPENAKAWLLQHPEYITDQAK